MPYPKTLKIVLSMTGILVIGTVTPSVNSFLFNWMRIPPMESLLGGTPSPDLPLNITYATNVGKTGIPSLELAKVLSPVKGESPEELELKKNPPPPHPEQGEAKSKADLMRACGQQPQCRQKLNEAKNKGMSKKPLPANSSKSPEELELDKFPAPVLPSDGMGRQKSDLQLFSPHTSLVGWLNPFSPSEAHAQTDVSIRLTPCNKRHSLAGLAFWGVDLPFSNPYARFVPLTKTRASSTNYLPYLSMYFNAPSTGWYILSFRATRAAASLRHDYSGPILETWDFMSEPNGWYDYVTIEYLAQGSHTFVWWGTQGWPHLASVTITSFP